LANETRIKARDLRLIDPAVSEISSISVRNNAILVNLLVNIKKKCSSIFLFILILFLSYFDYIEFESNCNTQKCLFV